MRVKDSNPTPFGTDPKSGAATNYAIPALFYKNVFIGTNIVFFLMSEIQKESGAQLISPFLVKIRKVAH